MNHTAAPLQTQVARALAVLCLVSSGLAQAQTTVATPATAAAPIAGGVEQKYEQIVHEDAGSKIQETRLGGVTRSITVESKLGGQPYEVVPPNGTRNIEPGWNNAKDSAGKAQWSVGSF